MGSDLRRRILDVSLDIVATAGVDALSFREVARRAGVSHQAPYRHFEDREAILAALVEEGFTALAEATEAAARGAPTPAERLAAAGSAYVQTALARPGHYRLLFRPDLVDARRHPGVAAAGARAYAVLERLGAELDEAGLLDAEPGAREVFVAWAWATVHGLAGLLLDGPLPARGSALEGPALANAASALGARLLRRGAGSPS